MEIIRPYEAMDNEVNKAQADILAAWAKKHEETIVKMEIFERAVNIFTESGREIHMSITEGCMSRYSNVRTHLYMMETVNGKQKRIKKEEW